MKYIKIIACLFLVFIISTNIASVYGGFLDDLFGAGKNFLNPNVTSGNINDATIENLTTTINTGLNAVVKDLINPVGNLIFFISAAFLGVKYIWSSVEGKSKVKETLPTFVVAACLFYLSSTVYGIITGSLIDITSGTTFESVQTSIWGTVSLVINILAIAGIVALGLKYMISSADTKADIKKDMIPVVIGLIFVYTTNALLSFIVNVGTEIM